MRRVILPRCGLAVSRLGFGTSRLHYLVQADASGLIREALDSGITHFDTARLYGDGFAEHVLGSALAGHRPGVTVGTKFGILPSRLIERAGPLATPLRGARSVLRRLGVRVGPRRSWTVATLERSLAASLAALRSDYVDILFLHEPTIPELAQADDLLEALGRHKRAGRVRAVGVSSGRAAAEWLLERYGTAIDVVQMPEAEWRDGGAIPDISFGALATGPQMYGAAKPSTETVQVAIGRALARRPDGCLLVGTTRPAHLRELAALAVDGSR